MCTRVPMSIRHSLRAHNALYIILARIYVIIISILTVTH